MKLAHLQHLRHRLLTKAFTAADRREILDRKLALRRINRAHAHAAREELQGTIQTCLTVVHRLDRRIEIRQEIMNSRRERWQWMRAVETFRPLAPELEGASSAAVETAQACVRCGGSGNDPASDEGAVWRCARCLGSGLED